MTPLERAQSEFLSRIINPPTVCQYFGQGWIITALPGQQWHALRQPLNMNPGGINALEPVYRWHWRAKLPERHGKLLVVLARGKMNSVQVEFLEDGFRAITSRFAIRRAKLGCRA